MRPMKVLARDLGQGGRKVIQPMSIQHSTLRIAAATIATGLLTVGTAAPVFADNESRHAHSGSAAQHRHESAQSARASRRSEQGAAAGSAVRARRGPTSGAQSEGSHGRSDRPRHTPVTVCHRLGNGSFHVLTMDDSALKAHVGHGDIYPVPDSGCPAPAAGVPSPERGGEEEGGSATPPATDIAPDEAVGVHRAVLDRIGLADQVLGVQAERTANRTSAQVAMAAAGAQPPAEAAPARGVLPQTGAGDFATAMLAGLGLLAAGAGLLSRRRLVDS